MKSHQFFNLTKAAEIIGVSRMTIHRWVKQSKLKPQIIADYPLVTLEQLQPLVKRKCHTCYHNHYEDSTQTCACREIKDMKDGCEDWVWKWNYKHF